MLNGLDLFSGIGGLTIALSEWVKPVAYCENDRFAQAVLLSRMSDGKLPRAPIWDDVRTLRKQELGKSISVDIIYGGFPCQDISVAGANKGLAGKRSGLFQEIVRLTEEIQPTFVFLENVPAITTRGLDVVLSAFTQLRYDCRWTIVSAAEVGAPHLRKRWFLLAANSNSIKLWDEQGRCSREKWQNKTIITNNGKEKSLANTKRERSISCKLKRQSRYKEGLPSRHSEIIPNTMRAGLERQRQKPSGVSEEHNNISNDSWWATEPNVGRVVNGLPHRSHRIKGLGNAVVPAQAKEAFKRLCGIE